MATNKNKTIEKAEIALDVILEHDSKDSDCNIKKVLEEIIMRWKELD